MIGAGRVGSAVAARLGERGVAVREESAELVLLCVPDAAIADVAATIAPGPWVAHVSGATPLTALEPHKRRFGLHPLQTFTRSRSAEQLDGAWAAVTAETAEAREHGFDLARTLGLEPFELDDAARVLYHAGAAVASNYLVTIHRAASDLLEAAGAPPEALVPLMQRTIENGFELTGPIARGDWQTVKRHRQAIRKARPEYERLYDVLAEATPRGPPESAQHALGKDRPMKVVRTIAELQAARPAGEVGLVPTMGAYHAGHVALFEAARSENDAVVASLFVNPAQFGPGEDLARYPRDEERDVAIAGESGVDVLFVPAADELYPPGYQTWVEVEELSRPLEGAFRPGHFRGVGTVCLKLFNLVRPARAYFGQKDAQQVAVVRRMVRDLNLPLEIRVVSTVRDADGLALSSRNVFLSDAERERALALPRALSTRDAAQACRLLDGLPVDYVEEADLDGMRVLAAAIRVGSTRLIDNVLLEGDSR